MAPYTPIRIRGKRGAPKELKWNTSKKRKATPAGSMAATGDHESSRSTPSTPGSVSHRRRKRQPTELSKLEQLPTEVMQAIFEFSANLDLPLASPRLASQLASKHLYHSLTSIILARDLEHSIWTYGNIWPAIRLMDSRFFTWQFFRTWLQEECERRSLQLEWQKAHYLDEETWSSAKEEWAWHQLHPGGRLPPPVKLLRGPFTQDKIHFLRFLTSSFRMDPQSLAPFYIERAREGLQQAVSGGAEDVLGCFWNLGIWPDTELLRAAVIDSGCDKDMVSSIVDRELVHRRYGSTDIDFLDPSLWSWAEKVHANGNKKGRWLKDRLRDVNNQELMKDAVARNVNGTTS